MLMVKGNGLPGMSEEYANYAFISYSHKDEKWAAWIQQKLEAYRLPSVIRKEAGSTIPERIRPVFRDATDLGAGLLRDKLQEELESSRFLIVVCSPNSAKPNEEGKHWVNDEVTHFASLGRADRIIPLIVDGDEKSAFCPKLTELGILAVDATKKSRARTLNDVVAALLGIRPDKLWHREERLRRRKRAWRAAAALVLAAAGAWLWYDLNATHVEYYSDWVDEWGIPTGIPSQSLSLDQVRNRLFSYRFEYRGRKPRGGFFAPRVLRRVIMQNADGQTLDDDFIPFPENDYHSERPRCQILTYRENGDLESIDDYDCKNRLVVRHKFSGRGNTDVEHIRIVGGREIDSPLLAEGISHGSPEDLSDRSEIRRFTHTRDDRGRIVKTLFKKDRGIRAQNAEGVYGIAYHLDIAGRPIRKVYLGYNGAPHANHVGTAGLVYSFSNEGHLSRASFIGESGETKLNGNCGYAQVVYKRDCFGNAILTAFLDASGSPALRHNGTSAERMIIEKGHLIKYVFLDSERKPCASMDGYAIRSFQWSDVGDSLFIRYLDGKGRPCRTSSGYSEERLTFKDGDCIRYERFDEQGDPAPDENGVAGWFSKWGNHRELERIYFDSDLKPKYFPEYGAGFSAEYDDEGLETAFFLLDENKRPVEGAQGWAGCITEYEDGQAVRVRFVDGQGRLVLRTDDTAGWNNVFENGNVIEQTFIGEDDSPTLSSKGFASKRWTYRNGLVTSVRFLGVHGEPVLDKDGIAGGKYQYDGAGHETECIWFGLDEKPILNRVNGTAGHRSRFDDAGNQIEYIWIGTDGNPCSSSDGTAGWKSKFDGLNREIERMYIGVDGSPTILPENGTAGYRQEYDDCGNVISKNLVDVDGNVSTSSDGYSSLKNEYDLFGNQTKSRTYDENGNLVASLYSNGTTGWNVEYDRFSRETRTTFFGTNDMPVVAGNGYASYETKWDDLGRETGKRYYDENGNLTLRPEDLVAGWDDELTRSGTVVRRTYIDSDGKPRHHSKGVSGWKKQFDQRGNSLVFLFVDETDAPMTLRTKGIAGYRLEYDGNFNEIRRVNLGEDVNPKANFDGWVQRTRQYDGSGNIVEELYLDENGKPCLLQNLGYAGWRKSFEGDSTTTFYLDADGKPTRTKDGWSGTRETRDLQGNVEKLEYLDLDGSRFEACSGCAEIVSSFDETGNATNVVYLDAKGNAVPAGDNHSFGKRHLFDEFGNETMCVNIGQNGDDGVDDRGIACEAFSYDRFGRQIGLTFLGRDKRMLTDPELGMARITNIIDRQGNTVHFNMDAHGNPTIDCEGVYMEIATEDTFKNLEVRHLYFGTNGMPCRALFSGTAGWESEWDSRGNEVRRIWLGTENSLATLPEPGPHCDGYTIWKAKYDERNRITKRMFFDENERPVFISNGTAGLSWEYDDAGNERATMNLDVNGNPVEDASGCAITETDFDIFGRLVETRWLGVDGQPVLEFDSGCAGFRYSHDIFGNITNCVWLGLDGKPRKNKEGYAGYSQAFERGLCTSVRYYNTDGFPMAIPEGYAGVEKRYDFFGRMAEQWYLDVDGKPCTDTNGCAHICWSYGERGLCTEYSEFDLEGTLFSNAVHAAVKYVYEYDERGHETVRRFIDANGAVREGPNGFAIRTMKCDFAGRPVEQAYQDVDGKPVRNHENGVSIERREWDDRGNLVAVRYCDEKDMPCICSNGYASVETIYDIRGFATNVLHRGVDGNFIALPESGCTGWSSEIDRLGNEVKRTWIGTNGKTASDKNGAFGWTSAFARGKETERRWIGADGKPCRALDGTLGWDKTYDEYGTELAKTDVK